MRQKICMAGAVLFFIISVFMFSAPDAEAIPAFARQTGLSCSTCHFQHFPSLNAFGRSFKAGGYTMVGGQSMIEGDMLSMPSVLNASIVMKLRYQKTNGSDDTETDKGELQFPDEAALFLGGRIGDHVGFAYEMGLAGEGADNFTSFKMPFVFDVAGMKLSAIPFNTDALGASFGFELLNTGAQRTQRAIEHRSEMSAQQYIGTATAAEGIAFVAANNMGFVNVSLWAPSHTAKDIGPMSKYVRVAATPTVGDWDLGGGIQWWGGTTGIASPVTEGDIVYPAGSYITHAWALDAQAQGNIVSMPIGVYFSYASAEGGTGGNLKLFNCSDTGGDDLCDVNNPNDKTAWALIGELGVIPNKTTVSLAYRSGDKGTALDNEQTALTLGVTHLTAQNIQFQLNHSMYGGDAYDPKPASGGDQQTTLMLFTAF